MSGEGRGRRGAGGGGLDSCLVNGFLSLGDYIMVWDFLQGRGERGGVLNIFKVAFRIIVYCY